jgi:hypothetical protein
MALAPAMPSRSVTSAVSDGPEARQNTVAPLKSGMGFQYSNSREVFIIANAPRSTARPAAGAASARRGSTDPGVLEPVVADAALEALHLAGEQVVDEDVVLGAQPFHVVLAAMVAPDVLLAFRDQRHAVAGPRRHVGIARQRDGVGLQAVVGEMVDRAGDDGVEADQDHRHAEAIRLDAAGIVRVLSVFWSSSGPARCAPAAAVRGR